MEAKKVLIPPPKSPDVRRLVIVEGFPDKSHNSPIIYAGAFACLPSLEAVEDKKGVAPANYGEIGLAGCGRRQGRRQRRVLAPKCGRKTPKLIGPLLLRGVFQGGQSRKSCGRRPGQVHALV